MIKIPLSFEMGTVIWEDQSTFERVWDHPVLDIGSSVSEVKDDVKTWLNEHCHGRWTFGFNTRTYELRFESEQDAMLFKLRWL